MNSPLNVIYYNKIIHTFFCICWTVKLVLNFLFVASCILCQVFRARVLWISHCKSLQRSRMNDISSSFHVQQSLLSFVAVTVETATVFFFPLCFLCDFPLPFSYCLVFLLVTSSFWAWWSWRELWSWWVHRWRWEVAGRKSLGGIRCTMWYILRWKWQNKLLCTLRCYFVLLPLFPSRTFFHYKWCK